MKKIFYLAFFSVVFFNIINAKAQYPFGKYPAIKSTDLVFHSWYCKDSSRDYLQASLSSLGPLYSNYSILIEGNIDSFSAVIYIKAGEKIMQQFDVPWMLYYQSKDNIASIADYNSDGLMDIKISFNNVANGIGIMAIHRLCLLQSTDHNFKAIAYTDMACEFEFTETPNKWLVERDFNRDGKFEVITCQLIFYGNHSYWSFDVYKFEGDKLVCVDDKFGYPIMIQYLESENYNITKKISREKMKTFKMPKPEGYEVIEATKLER